MSETRKEIITISGMHCVSCSTAVEHALKDIKGVTGASVNYAAGKAYVTFDPMIVAFTRILQVIEDTGYEVVKDEKNRALDFERAAREEESEGLKRKFWLSCVLAVPLLYLSMGRHLPPFHIHVPALVNAAVQMLLTTGIMLACLQFYRRGIISLIKTGAATMDTLIAVGTGSAYLYSVIVTISLFRGKSSFGTGDLYFEVAGLLLVFILLGKWFEAIAKGKTSAAIKLLMELAPRTAVVMRDGSEIEIPVENVVVGDIVVVKPGQKVPVDGEVTDGYSSVNESMITGESIPVEKKTGDEVIDGTINGTGTFTFRATKVGDDTVLAQIVKLVEDAQGSRAPVQELADKISAYFVPAVAAIALLSFIIWILAGQNFIFALTIFIAVLIIACPCALGLATPTAVMVSTGMAARNGILIKSAQAIQTAETIDTVVFDKTGTLTRGKPRVTDYETSDGVSAGSLLVLAASVENRSEHPLARAVLDLAKEKAVSLRPIEDFSAAEGKGVRASAGNSRIFVGKKDYLIENAVVIPGNLERRADALSSEGKTVLWVGKDSACIGIFAIADTVKDHARDVVRQLKASGKKVVMITGDHSLTARAIAATLDIDDVKAEVLPKDKAAEISALKEAGSKVAMVGDGINDAPALAVADLGIALGSGTDIAIESAHIVLVRDDIRDVLAAIDLSRFAMKKIRQNLFWAFFYNIIGIPIAAGVLYPFTGFLLNPMIAGAAMAFSSVSVVSNSLLIKNYKKSRLSD